MPKRSARKTRRLDLLVTALISLFVAAACLWTRGPVPESFRDALRWDAWGPVPVGPLGALIGRLGLWALGPVLLWLLPALPWLWLPLSDPRTGRRALRRMVWPAVGLIAGAALVSHPRLVEGIGYPPSLGGALGRGLEQLTRSIVGPVGSFLLLASAVAWLVLRRLPAVELPLSALLSTGERLWRALRGFLRGVGHAGSKLRLAGRRLQLGIEAWREERRFQTGDSAPSEEPDAASLPKEGPGADELPWLEDERQAVGSSGNGQEGKGRVPTAVQPEMLDAAAQSAAASEDFRLSRDPAELLAEEPSGSGSRRRRRRGYTLPSLDLLDDVAKEERGFSREVLQMSARLLLETLANYGIDGQINEIRPGPVVTTFEFEPAPGVKVSQITSRADDLALAMRAIRIRIEAPIPGKAAVGIEIPNPFPQIVGLKQVVGTMPDDGDRRPLAIALGKDTEGAPFTADLADMPHLLVAGATGSGKSVCINAIICNLLLRNGPERVRLLMIDPKMLELSVYNGIPHLMHPVITEAREALKAVKYMVAEMETRYALLAREGVRNINDFNDRVRQGRVRDAESGERMREPLPYCVFIIDELADLMMQLGSDLETPVARLAQMARAVGIHLVLATQRPSVNVITGVIKANFPSRIGFRVISKVDSRTILDGAGAEQLLGKGDMLILLAGMPQPKRVHGAYLSVEECERIVEHWGQYAEEENRLDLDGPVDGGSLVELGDDELLEQARRLVVVTQSGSTTMLQRRLRVGYTRAARLMDMLEASGVVGPYEGSKARKVLVPKSELESEA